MIAEDENFYNMAKEIKSYIYQNIYDVIAQGEDFENYGLSYAVNALLARQLDLPLPETPQKKMSRGSRIKYAKLELNIVEVPSEWFDLLSALIIGETWFRKDYPKFAHLVEKCGLVTFVRRFGATPTDKLKEILEKEDRFKILKKLITDEAADEGHQLKFIGSGD
jgi:hypothetical protein